MNGKEKSFGGSVMRFITRTFLPSCWIALVPLSCLWVFTQEQMLGRVMLQGVVFAAWRLGHAEFNVLPDGPSLEGPFAYRNSEHDRKDKAREWNAMTTASTLFASGIIWLLPDKGVWIVVCLTLATWVSEICAFATGWIATHVFNHRRLGEIWPWFQKSSPNKSIAGTVADLVVLLVLLGALLNQAVQWGWLEPGTFWFVITSIALVIYAVFGIIGDFYESSIKRLFGDEMLKDSSNYLDRLDPEHTIPWGRHGGLNDRLDSTYFGSFAVIATATTVVVGLTVGLFLLIVFLIVIIQTGLAAASIGVKCFFEKAKNSLAIRPDYEPEE